MTTPEHDPNVYVTYLDTDGTIKQFVGNVNLVSVVPTGVVYSDQAALMQYFVPHSRILMIRSMLGNVYWG